MQARIECRSHHALRPFARRAAGGDRWQPSSACAREHARICLLHSCEGRFIATKHKVAPSVSTPVNTARTTFQVANRMAPGRDSYAMAEMICSAFEQTRALLSALLEAVARVRQQEMSKQERDEEERLHDREAETAAVRASCAEHLERERRKYLRLQDKFADMTLGKEVCEKRAADALQQQQLQMQEMCATEKARRATENARADALTMALAAKHQQLAAHRNSVAHAKAAAEELVQEAARAGSECAHLHKALTDSEARVRRLGEELAAAQTLDSLVEELRKEQQKLAGALRAKEEEHLECWRKLRQMEEELATSGLAADGGRADQDKKVWLNGTHAFICIHE